MSTGRWRSPNYRQPDLGTPGRFRMDPAARDIIRKYKRDGFLNAVGMGEFGAVREMELEAECAVHNLFGRGGWGESVCTCPVEYDDDD